MRERAGSPPGPRGELSPARSRRAGNVPSMSASPSTSSAEGQPGFNALLGLRYDAVGPDGVTLSLDVRPELLQPYGIVHGGVWCSLVETAASVAAAQWYGDRGRVVGVANHTDFLHAIGSGTVTAVASPIHRGRMQQLWLVEIRAEADRLVARGEVRIQNLPARPADD